MERESGGRVAAARDFRSWGVSATSPVLGGRISIFSARLYTTSLPRSHSAPRPAAPNAAVFMQTSAGAECQHARTQPARQPLGLRTLQRVPREHPAASRLASVRCMRLYSGSCFCWLSLLFQRYRCKNKSRSFIVHTSSLFRRLSMTSVTPWLPTNPAVCVHTLVCRQGSLTRAIRLNLIASPSAVNHHAASHAQALFRQDISSILEQHYLPPNTWCRISQCLEQYSNNCIHLLSVT